MWNVVSLVYCTLSYKLRIGLARPQTVVLICNVQDTGEELLQYCIQGDWDIAKVVVTTGCNLEAKNKVITPSSSGVVPSLEWLKAHSNLYFSLQNGATALHLSCMKGNMDMIDVLLQHGASVRVKDNVSMCMMKLFFRDCEHQVCNNCFF